MGFGFGKSSPRQPWTLGSFPGTPMTPMLFTSMPTYAVASPSSSFSSQPVIPIATSPMVMPMSLTPAVQQFPVPVAVQSPMVLSPVVLPATTMVQSAPYVPSPVVHTPIPTYPPRNPSPRPAQTPLQRDNDGAASLLLVQPPQQAMVTPSNFTINVNMTPQQQSTPLGDHLPEMYNDNRRVTSARSPVTVPSGITAHTTQDPSNGGWDIRIQCTPRSRTPPQIRDSWP